MNSEILVFDSETEYSEEFLVTPRTKAPKVYPVASPTPVPPIDVHALDDAIEQDRAKDLRSALESIQFKLGIKIFLLCLLVRAVWKKNSQRVQKFCVFARKQFFHNF